MKYLLAIFLLLLLVQCDKQHTNSIPTNARLIAKYQVLDEIISPDHVKCGGITQDFLKASPYTCSFKVQGLEFDIEKKYLIDTNGSLKGFAKYLAEGPLIYTVADLSKDSSYLKDEHLENFHITFNPHRIGIVDNRYTITIERIFTTKKLILARKNNHTPKGRRFLYQYQ